MYNASLGGLVAGLVALYGTLVSINLALLGNRGGLRSPEFLLLAVLVGLVLFTNLSGRVAAHVIRNGLTVVLLLLAAHVLVGGIRLPPAEGRVLLGSYVVVIARGFLLGFIAMSGIRLRLRLPGRSWASSSGGAAILAGAAFWGVLTVVFLSRRDLIRTDLFGFITAESYYQTIGDYYVIALAVVLGSQLDWFRAEPRSGRHVILFSLTAALQGIASFLLLQLFGSNKGSVHVALMSAMALGVVLWSAFPVQRWRIRLRRVWTYAALGVALVIGASLLSRTEFAPMRILDFGGTGNILANRSLTSRVEFLQLEGLRHLTRSPVIGSPGIGITDGRYLHSLVSVQSHLGIIGTLLIGTVLVVGYRRLQRVQSNGVLKVALLPTLLVGMISSFYVWMPFWFLLGGLAALPPISFASTPDTKGSAGR